MTIDTPPRNAPTRRRMLAWRVLWSLLGTIVLLIACAAGVVAWATRSEAGMRTLLSFVPGLQVRAPQGTLLGDFAAESAEIALARGGAVVLTQPHWQNLRFERLASAPWGWQLVVDVLEASHVQWRAPAADPQAQPATAPQSLSLPVGVEVALLRIGSLSLSGSTLAPVRELQARIHLAAGAGQHRLDDVQLGWDRLRLRGTASLGAQAPLLLRASATLTQTEAPTAAGGTTALPWEGWTAQLGAEGPLARFALSAALRARAQRLDASAEITPFAPLPLGRVDASTEALDLAALASGAPTTALSGSLHAALTQPANSDKAAMPLVIGADLRNAAAGRWDAGRLPVRRVVIDALGNAADTRRGALRRFEIELGTAAEAGGAASGSGNWDGERWLLDARLQDALPAVLDRRAPLLALSGSVQLQGVGNPAALAPAAPAPGAAATPPSLDLKAAIQGRSTEAKAARAKNTSLLPAAWQVQLDAGARPALYTLRKLEARSAGALARLTAEARREASAPAQWQLRGDATLANADPTLASGGAASQGSTSRLNGDAHFDLHLPERAPDGSGFAPWLAAWRGSANARLQDSQLAGVPLAGTLQLTSDGRTPVLVTASLAAAGNRAALRGRLDIQSGAGDRWDIETQAPALAALAPALHLWRPDLALSGTLTAQAQVNGRWPALASRGEAQASALTLPGLALGGGQARWDLGTAANAPFNLHLQAAQLTLGAQRFEAPSLQIEGTGSSHVAKLHAEAVAPPPPVVARRAVSAAARGDATALRLVASAEAQGGWRLDAARATLGWRGRVRQIDLRSAAAADAQPPVLWLHAEPFDVDWSQGAASGQQLNVSATRIAVLDAALRLRQLAYAALPGQPTRLDVQAELEPLAVAPVLARIQPDFGWGGSLVLAGRLDLHTTAAGFRADALLERVSGDLSVTDPNLAQAIAPMPPGAAGAASAASASGASAPSATNVRGVTQRLGLRELRFALGAQDGTWRFTQQVQGRNLGSISGAQTVHADARAVWPAANAPLDGRLDVQVDNLATWGGWVPAGWRLVGQLAMQARVGGSFGAPEYTGRLTGTGLGARQLLDGIDVHDGEVDIALQGATARIERFVVRAGEGSARLEGRADFGTAPRAQLELVAEHFAVLTRVDRKLVVSGQASLGLAVDELQLDGSFTADEALIDISSGDAPSVSDDVSVLGRRDVAEAEAAAASAPRRNVTLKLALDLGQRFRLRGRGLDTLLRGALVATAPGGKPALAGTIRTEGGTFNAYAQKLTIARGSVVFNGPIDNPRLDILALRTQSITASESDVKVGVAITGPAQSPRVRLYSEPEMSDTEKLSWLVLGRGSGELGRTEVALVQQAALALLAGESGGPNDNVLKTIGLDELSVRQSDGEVRETVLSVGKQLSQRWYVGYERSLNATTGNWQLMYRVAQRYTLRAQTGLDNAFDVIWTWRWQ